MYLRWKWDLSNKSMMETEVTCRQDGGPRKWVKLEVDASEVGGETTRSGVRGSRVAPYRLGCAPGCWRPCRRCQPMAIGGKPCQLAVAWRGDAVPTGSVNMIVAVRVARYRSWPGRCGCRPTVVGGKHDDMRAGESRTSSAVPTRSMNNPKIHRVCKCA
jgi:hypothetical protein